MIPRNDGQDTEPAQRRTNLITAIREIHPLLASTGLTALIETLGFGRASLRYKAEAIDAIETVGAKNAFKIVHDTFHHTLAQETEFFPQWTGMVHISGVVDPSLSVDQMEDEHRILVDANDRLGNLEQLKTLQSAGYDGPVSFEAFAPSVHQEPNPANVLKKSMAFIDAALAD